MNITLAVVISIIFTVLKMAVHYKESPRPNVKDSFMVFVSCLGGIYAMDHFGKVTPKVTEVFTETPPF
jgi:hypothetical protein